MSKERELLRRLVHWCWQVGTIPVVLHEEIEELLAQPEQEKEPLSIDKLKAIAVEDEFLLFCDEYEFIEIARAIEKAHGIGL